MRFANRMALLLVALLVTLNGCDWIRGSTLSWSQSLRTWDPIESDNCLLVGTYIFRRDTEMPSFQGKSSVQMRTESKEDQEFLPQYFDLKYYLNDDLFYTQAFELNKGKGKLSETQYQDWEFNSGDVLDWEACARGGGVIPIFTEISLKVGYKFDKLSIPNF